MTGIFYDPACRRLRLVRGKPEPGWAFVTHNVEASSHHCRRILRELVPPEELATIDWRIEDDDHRSA